MTFTLTAKYLSAAEVLTLAGIRHGALAVLDVRHSSTTHGRLSGAIRASA